MELASGIKCQCSHSPCTTLTHTRHPTRGTSGHSPLANECSFIWWVLWLEFLTHEVRRRGCPVWLFVLLAPA